MSNPYLFSLCQGQFEALTLRNLRRNLDDRLIPIQAGSRLKHEEVAVTLHSFIDQLGHSHRVPRYARQLSLARHFPELVHLRCPEHVPADRIVMRSVWIGPAGSLNPLHRDNVNPYAGVANCFVQCDGAKRWLLIGPEHSAVLLAYPAGGNNPHHVGIDAGRHREHPDPRIRDIGVIPMQVAAGSGLYVPPGWWHQVEGMASGVSVSHFFFPSRFADAVARINSSFRGVRIFDRDGHNLGPARINAEDIAEFGGYEFAKLAIRHMCVEEKNMFSACLELDVDRTLLV